MTTAKVTRRGTAENPIFDFELPAGPKGEPGGFTAATALGDAHLDTITTPGLYAQSSPAKILVEKGYPFGPAGASGRLSLMVRNWGGSGAVVQTIDTIGTGTIPSLTYTRYVESAFNVATPWKVKTPQRVDNTAGRAIYTWDPTQNREQLIYGDTGWRNVKELLLPGFTAVSIRIRRTSSLVTMAFDGLTGTVAGHATFINAISGFSADSTLASAANQRLGPVSELNSSASLRWVSPEPGNAHMRILNYVANTGLHGMFSYFTADPWPTTLPGVPNGPNPSPA